MEVIILSLGLLCITFWKYFSTMFGKAARIIIATLFMGLATCAIMVTLYVDTSIVVCVAVFAGLIVFMDFKRVYDNYGHCDDAFKFYNMEIMKVSVMMLCMCLAGRYVNSRVFEGEAVKLFYCIAMTGLVAIVDASKQSRVYADFEPSDDDVTFTGYVVGYHGRAWFGKSKLVIEVDMNEHKKPGETETANIFEEYRMMDRRGSFDGNGRYVKYDRMGRRMRKDAQDPRFANSVSFPEPVSNRKIMYFITAMYYEKNNNLMGDLIPVRFSDSRKMLYIEDEVKSNKEGLMVCTAVGVFAFFSCLTYFMGSL